MDHLQLLSKNYQEFIYTLSIYEPIYVDELNWNDFNVMSLERWLASAFIPNWHAFIYFQVCELLSQVSQMYDWLPPWLVLSHLQMCQ